jgi:hypothetical protein
VEEEKTVDSSKAKYLRWSAKETLKRTESSKGSVVFGKGSTNGGTECQKLTPEKNWQPSISLS